MDERLASERPAVDGVDLDGARGTARSAPGDTAKGAVHRGSNGTLDHRLPFGDEYAPDVRGARELGGIGETAKIVPWIARLAVEANDQVALRPAEAGVEPRGNPAV